MLGILTQIWVVVVFMVVESTQYGNCVQHEVPKRISDPLLCIWLEPINAAVLTITFTVLLVYAVLVGLLILKVVVYIFGFTHCVYAKWESPRRMSDRKNIFLTDLKFFAS